MANYKWYTVRIPIEVGSDLDKRIDAYCKAAHLEDCKATVVSNAAVTGIVHHINDNLEFMERGLRKCGEA